MASSRTISLVKKVTKNETLYVGQFYCTTSTDRKLYDLKYGDSAAWAPNINVTSQSTGRKPYVKEVEVIEFFPGTEVPCIIKTTASSRIDGSNFGTIANMGDRYVLEYETKDFYFDPKFWGAHRATKSEIDSNPALKDVWDNTAGVNSIIYDNGLSANFRSSPFGDIKDGDNTDVTYIDKIFPTTVYKVTFFDKANKIDKYQAFWGVNPGSSAFPTSYSPGDTTAKIWKAMSNSAIHVLDERGEQWTKVVRTMQKAPCDLKWLNEDWPEWKWKA